MHDALVVSKHHAYAWSLVQHILGAVELHMEACKPPQTLFNALAGF